MKNLINLLLFFLISTNLFSQGIGNSKTTQSLQFPTSETVPEDKARVYVMRTTGTLWNYSVTVYLDEKVIGKVGPKSYLMFDIDTENEVRIGTAFIGNNVRDKNEENQEFLTIKPKPGKIYYVGVKAKYGTFRGQTEITPLENNEAIKLIPKLDKPKANYIE
ncbi:hypothetical protein [Kaistella faecalis]|uniref:hypothetical protein n=1 Tax=Kaistella faecalis TaxID=2852098 RepID=UPI001C4932C0|nr:hypothetical protein [Chryseobacterium faecale]UFK97401.1 hypothetical protein LL667_10595 [Chryseobacterium faecale]